MRYIDKKTFHGERDFGDEPFRQGGEMESIIEAQIKKEIFRFNATLFDLVKGIDRQLDLDEETLTIIENSNKLLIFCAVKDIDSKKAGETVSVIYNEEADCGTNPFVQRISFGRSLAQYGRYYRNSKGACQTIPKKESMAYVPETIRWSYQFRNFILYQNMDGSYGLCKKAMS